MYYSHILKVLFLSYAQGKSFVAFLPYVSEGTSNVYEINLNSNAKNGLNSSSKSSTSSTSQPLCQWTEVPTHPGLICCMMQSSKLNGILSSLCIVGSRDGMFMGFFPSFR